MLTLYRDGRLGYAALMATGEVVYKHEYVSGPIFAMEEFSAVIIAVANRGANVEHFRVYSFHEQGPWLESPDDEPIEPQDVRVWDPKELEAGPYWFRIFTTSLDVVPSLSTRESTSDPERAITNPHLGVYYAPGDFAVFNIHPVSPPPRPPIGPVT